MFFYMPCIQNFGRPSFYFLYWQVIALDGPGNIQSLHKEVLSFVRTLRLDWHSRKHQFDVTFLLSNVKRLMYSVLCCI